MSRSKPMPAAASSAQNRNSHVRLRPTVVRGFLVAGGHQTSVANRRMKEREASNTSLACSGV